MAPSFGADIAPETSSFSSHERDWTLPLPPDAAPWTERWGRKALGWTLGLAGMVALAATAAWMYRDTQVESTLAVVADHTPAQANQSPAGVAPATPAEAGLRSEPAADPLPPLRLLPPEPVAGAAREEARAGAVATEAPAPAAAPAAAVAREAAPPRPPAADPEAERRVAAATPIKRTPPAARKPASATRAKPASATRAKPASPTRPKAASATRSPATRAARAAPASQASPQPPADSPLSETLRLCRAAGYHATACLKRGCEATRFGLVCRG
ncbi:hypothetical protein IM543_13735 [Massilia sp. UMI-21]|nr:hypothetical protein IM543_13735 [Massilia sp. UMI-21]